VIACSPSSGWRRWHWPHSSRFTSLRFASGELEGEELMSGFLVHASDARDFLIRLILHERDNLEDHARAQHRPVEALWNEAVGERRHTAEDAGADESRKAAQAETPPSLLVPNA
jgi:hypothetical protein